MRTNWTLAFASATGKSHRENNIPCQDAFRMKRLPCNCGIAIVADGAGSSSHSQLGSRLLADIGITLFSDKLSKSGFLRKKRPLRKDHWRRIVLKCFTQLQTELIKLSDDKGLHIKNLSSTIIVVAFSPWGIMSAHIGDGRAAYCNLDKLWQSIITPFSGSEAGATVFFTTKEVWDKPDRFIETRCIKDNVTGFSLSSDGLEKTTFLCYVKYPNKELFSDPNKPFEEFFNPIGKSLYQMSAKGWNQRKINATWQDFLDKGNERLINESDDKTMIIGILRNSIIWQE